MDDKELDTLGGGTIEKDGLKKNSGKGRVYSSVKWLR